MTYSLTSWAAAREGLRDRQVAQEGWLGSDILVGTPGSQRRMMNRPRCWECGPTRFDGDWVWLRSGA